MAGDTIHIDTRQRILFFGRPIGTVKSGIATVDAACFVREVNSFLIPRCKKIIWQSGVAEKLAREDSLENAHLIKKARVYQLKPEVDPTMRFIGYEQLMAVHGGVAPANYILVFDGDIGTDDAETAYQLFRDSPPPGYKGHPLTRSDVLELYNPKQRKCFYIDTFALRPIDFEYTNGGILYEKSTNRSP